MALVLAVAVAVVALAVLARQHRALASCRTTLAEATARADALAATEQRLTAAEQRLVVAERELEACTEVRALAEEGLAASAQSLAGAEDAMAEAAVRAGALEAERQAAEQLAADRDDARHAAEQLAADRDDARHAAEQLANDRDDARRAAEQLAADCDDARRAAEHERDRLARELDAARTAPADTMATARPLLDPAGGAAAPAILEASWRLLVSRIERQWASAVGAGPQERGVVDGPPEAQLDQALAREAERLREEVGVDTAVAGTAGPGSAHPLVVLLAAGELAAVAAPHSERVVVELAEGLVVLAEGWTGGAAGGEQLRETVAVAGLGGAVDERADAVRVVVGRGPDGDP